MPFVQAKCPNCGGVLAVDQSHDAALCQYCNTPFIVEKAINNFNVTVSGNLSVENANITVSVGPSVDSLLTRANDFYDTRDFRKAFEYYDRVLDLDPRNIAARTRLEILSKPQENNLLVSRVSSLSGCASHAKIFVDGREIGSVKNGGYADYMISLGEHDIYAKLAFNKSNCVHFALCDAFQRARVIVTMGSSLSISVSVD